MYQFIICRIPEESLGVLPHLQFQISINFPSRDDWRQVSARFAESIFAIQYSHQAKEGSFRLLEKQGKYCFACRHIWLLVIHHLYMYYERFEI
jgi:hypothetical protein